MNLIFKLIFGLTMNAQVMIQAPETKNADFLKQVRQNSGAKLFSEWWLKARSTSAEELTLIGDFEQAENLFLNADIKTAKKQYEYIVHRHLKSDWTAKARQAIFNSYFRLASLETDHEDRNRWIEKAIAFDSTLEPDEDLFAPPLRESYQNLKRSSHLITISTATWPSSISTILVNGRELKKTDSFVVPLAPFRLTVVSESYSPFSQTLKAKDLKEMEFHLEPLVLGNCGAPEWTKSSESYPKLHQVIYPNGCVVENSTTPKIKLSELAARPHEDTPIRIATQAPQPNSIFKSKWFWIGIGVAAGGFLAYQQSQNNQSPAVHPTIKEAY